MYQQYNMIPAIALECKGMPIHASYMSCLQKDPTADNLPWCRFINHYPSTEGRSFPAGVQRISAHTDFEMLTLLFNEGSM